MSKGKRKSDPEVLKLVRERLRCRAQGQTFTEADRELLNKLARTDLIYILEDELGFGPLKSSQKNSVARMVEWLLTKQIPAGYASTYASDIPAEVKRESSLSVADHHARACGETGGEKLDTILLVENAPSAGGSCQTPSPGADTPVPLEQQATDGIDAAAAAAAAAAADVFAGDPWLDELHQQLTAAGQMPPADVDNDSVTEADSGWFQPCSVATSQLLPCAVPAGVQSDALDTPAGMLGSMASLNQELSISQIEELLVQQLLLDIESKPKYKARRVRSSLATYGQQQQQQQMQMQMRQASLQQHYQVPQPPLMQPHPYLTAVQLQHQHQQLEQQMSELEVDCFLQDQVALQGALSAYPGQPQLVQPPLMSSFEAATWPLPTTEAAGTAGGAGSSSYELQPAGSSGLDVYAQCDPSSAPVLPGWPQGLQRGWSTCEEAGGVAWDQGARLPCETGASGSFLRKRDKMLMGSAQEARAGTPAWDPLTVEFSGPSADIPTKRMSVELPGSNFVTSMPTSFSGRMPDSASSSRPLPGDLLMQLTCFDDSSNVKLQQAQADASQLHAQQLPQLPASDQPHLSLGVSRLTSKLKTLLRGSAPKAKARRHNSVGAGGSFSVNAAPADVSRLPSADGVLFGHGGAQAPAVLAAGSRTASGAWSSNPNSLVMSQGPGPVRAAADGRMWRSMMNIPTAQQASDPCMMTPPALGGLSWHAERSTLLGQSCHTAAAQSLCHLQQNAADAAGQLPYGVTATNSHFAQQLEQLRVLYGDQCDDEDALQSAVPASTLNPAMPPIAEACTPAAASVGRQCGVEAAWASVQDTPKHGFVGKLRKAFQLDTHPTAHALPELTDSHTDTGGGGGALDQEQDDDLLLAGRCDGEVDLVKAILQWQVGAADLGVGNSCAGDRGWEAEAFDNEFLGLATLGDDVGAGGTLAGLGVMGDSAVLDLEDL